MVIRQKIQLRGQIIRIYTIFLYKLYNKSSSNLYTIARLINLRAKFDLKTSSIHNVERRPYE